MSVQALPAPPRTSVPFLPKTNPDGTIEFELVSDGTTPESWIQQFERHPYRITDEARIALAHVSEPPTTGTAYHILVCTGASLGMRGIILKNLWPRAEKERWGKPHWEVGCLLRRTLTTNWLREWGLRSVVAMHEPVLDPAGNPYLLAAYGPEPGDKTTMCAYPAWMTACWTEDNGFAFLR